MSLLKGDGGTLTDEAGRVWEVIEWKAKENQRLHPDGSAFTLTDLCVRATVRSGQKFSLAEMVNWTFPISNHDKVHTVWRASVSWCEPGEVTGTQVVETLGGMLSLYTSREHK